MKLHYILFDFIEVYDGAEVSSVSGYQDQNNPSDKDRCHYADK